jgi:hypothetical protein
MVLKGVNMSEMTEEKVHKLMKVYNKQISYYNDKLQNKNNYFLESNLIFFKKQRRLYLNMIRTLQEKYPEHFI